MNESLELSLLCSVHTATVVYIGTYRTLCIHLQPVQQRGHHKQAIASLAGLLQECELATEASNLVAQRVEILALADPFCVGW